uniref:Sphingosine kinase 1 n=1 Tax=Suricata suricatta TaxID=37032 RepID=A0A673VA19_SURSU
MPESAAPRARSDDVSGRCPSREAAPDSASAVSSPSDPAAAGNVAGTSAAPAPGQEGEPLCRHRVARPGSIDKERKAGAAAAGSSPTARGTRRQQEPRGEVMNPAGGARSQLPARCRVLVLLNPRGGKGKGLQLFWSHVQPRLAQADISFTLMLTERRNHARELVQGLELERWDAIVVMSGDGLMFEVVNGLMERPDWETAIRKPLCSLPAGSGNALAASLNYYAGYEQVTSGLRLFSVLSLAWGFVADVDLESEKFRGLGELRFTLGTFLRLAALRVYQGRLAYLPAGRGVPGMPGSPAADRWDRQGPTDGLLVPLEEPVPAHWTVVPEQDFVLVLALLHSHLGSEMFAAPMGRSAAGTMHLFYVRAGVSRAMLLRLFLAMEKGRHMEQDCPYLVYVPVVAFRLEPKDGKGVFAADGELLVSEAVQGQVHADYIWMVSGCVEPPPSRKPQRGAPPEKPL